MKEFDRGIIISKKYENTDFYIIREVGIGEEKKYVTLNLQDNIINLDPTISHEFQLSLILQTFYPEKMALDWLFYLIDVKKREKENRIGFHLHEMIYASFFASLGEVVVLNCELEENYGSSSLYFFPKDLSLLTGKQKEQLRLLLPAVIGTEFVEGCFCNSSYEENQYFGKEQLIELVSNLNQKKEISKK